ncbi:MAG: hypothetical protein JWM49_904 [Microbacteriaceae bacterium]|nr:hypothetical protein [Microbacteriaceae bacterium]
MANTNGGLLIYGVAEPLKLVGLSPDDISDANIRSLEQLISSRVKPYLDGVEMCVLDSGDGGCTLLVVDVPASEFAPHLIYGAGQRDKNHRAAVVPERYGRDTIWMDEHQLAQSYRERFARQTSHAEILNELIDFAAEQCLEAGGNRGWLVMAAAPVRVLRGHPTLERHRVLNVAQEALRRGMELRRALSPPTEILRSLDSAGQNPRTGYHRWVLSNFLSRSDSNTQRPIYLELHLDGSCALGIDLTWRLNELVDGEAIYLRGGVVDAAAADFVAVAQALSNEVLNRAPMSINAKIFQPTESQRPLVLLDETSDTKVIEREWTRHLSRTQTVFAELRTPEDIHEQRLAAHGIASGILNQFGADSMLPRPARA